MNPVLSIITVNYNNKKGLQNTVQSVINQSIKNFEYIIVDGNSTDGSQEIFLNQEYSFTHIISEPDTGIYNAMNKGIKISTGNYLLFLNSGDCLSDSTVLERIFDTLDGTYGIYYGDIIFQHANRDEVVRFPDKLTFNFFFTNNISHQASFIKRSLFSHIFFYNENYQIVSDWEFFVYAICKVNVSYKHLNIITTIYDGSGLSSLEENKELDKSERKAVLANHFPMFIDDYYQIAQLKQKRVAQFFFIKENPVGWKILKAVMKLVLLFLPGKR